MEFLFHFTTCWPGSTTQHIGSEDIATPSNVTVNQIEGVNTLPNILIPTRAHPIRQSGSSDQEIYDRRVREQQEGLKKTKELRQRLKKAKGPKKRKPLIEELERRIKTDKMHQQTIDQMFPNGRPK